MNETAESDGDLFAREVIEHFTGTNVPRKALFDHLAEGGSLDSFVSKFPAVRRERAEWILIEAEMKQRELVRAGKPAESLHAAYLAHMDEPPDKQFLLDCKAIADVANDEEEMRRVMAERGYYEFTEEMIDEMEAEVRRRKSS